MMFGSLENITLDYYLGELNCNEKSNYLNLTIS